ncbi:mechanosensitive ion channel family protein [Bifidobacterium aerophilum]
MSDTADAGLDMMNLMIKWLTANAGKIVFLIVVLVAAWAVVKVVSKVLRRVLDHTDMPSASIFVNIVRVLIWVVAATIVLKPVFGIDPTTLMTALGVGGIAVSLGLKDTVANVISGFGLMFGRVIQPGDLVTVAGTTGVVKDITWRQTVVRERNGNEMVIPNSVLNTASLEKLTPANEGLVTVPFTAKAGSDVKDVERRIVEAVKHGTIDVAAEGTVPIVKFTGFSPYGIEGQVLVFAKPDLLLSTARDAAARALSGVDALEQRAAVGA